MRAKSPSFRWYNVAVTAREGKAFLAESNENDKVSELENW
jgi:hypothetical protein